MTPAKKKEPLDAPERRRSRMNVLLVSCYELGRQPLAVASAVAFLEREGFLPATLDVSVEALDDVRLAAAELIAISVPMHTALRLGLKVAEHIRELNPRAHICFYGLYASLNAEWLLEGEADSVAGGECELVLVALARALQEGRTLDVPGLSRPGRTALPVIARPAYPVPSRGGLPPLERYAKIEIGGRTGLAAAVEASRGCLHLCTHCPIPSVYDGRFFAVPVEIVLADIAGVVAAGATHITFADPDFLNGPAHARRIVEATHARFPALTFDFTAKIEHLLAQRELLPVFARAGCAFLVSAVESLSNRVLGILQKNHTAADVMTALRLTREANISLRPSLLPFTPWSTREDYIALLDFVAENDLLHEVDPVQFSIRLLVPPGSLLEKHPAMLPFWRELQPDPISRRWDHPDPGMDRLHIEATRIVAEGARLQDDPEAIFGQLRAAAGAARARAIDTNLRRPPAPRLTEPWFC